MKTLRAKFFSGNYFELPALFGFLLLLFLVSCGTKGNDQDKVVGVARSDKAMNEAMEKARREVDSFIEILNTDKEIKAVSVKIPVKEKDEVEHFWLSELKFSNGSFTGKIANDPDVVKNVKFGQEVTVEKNKISDWMYLKNGFMYGNYTLRVLMPRMSKKEIDEINSQFKFK